MKKIKIILSIILSSLILFTTTAFAKTGTVNAPNTLILRKEASKTSDVITTINDDASVEILEESGEWYKVKYNDYEGYLFAEYVDIKEDSTTTDTEQTTVEQKDAQESDEKQQQTAQYPQKQTIKSDLKIYSIPSITAKTIDTIKKDQEITVNYELNNWFNITCGNTQGWVRKYFIQNQDTTTQTNSEDVDTSDKADTEAEVKTIDNKKGYINVSSSANIREEASTSSNIINTLLRNTEVIITAEEGDFYKIKYNDITGYISKTLISDTPVSEVTSRSSEERKTETESNTNKADKQTNKESATADNTSTQTTSSNSSAGEKIVSYAKKYVGYAYTYGGTTPSTGFDCTGFTYYIYNSCGYSLSRSFSVQKQSGTAVSKANLKQGDLLIFDNNRDGTPDHVGIYIGSGNFIHAENSRTGVKTDTVSSGHYSNCYYSARRIVN